MKVNPQISLAFDGQCEAAFGFYERCLDGAIQLMLSWGDSPMAADAPPDWGAKIVHASIRIGDAEIAGSDVPPGRYERPRGFEILLNMDDPSDAERVFRLLAEGGVVGMPLQETFWASRFGMLVDRFGIPWSVNSGTPAGPTP